MDYFWLFLWFWPKRVEYFDNRLRQNLFWERNGNRLSYKLGLEAKENWDMMSVSQQSY